MSQACSAEPVASATELRPGMPVDSNLVQKDLISELQPELPGKGTLLHFWTQAHKIESLEPRGKVLPQGDTKSDIIKTGGREHSSPCAV